MSWSDRVKTGGAPLGIASALIAVAVASVQVRLNERWGAGTYLIVNLVPAAALLAAGLTAARGRGRPDGATTAMLVAGLALAAGACGALASLVGDGSAESIAFAALVFASVAAAVAKSSASPVVALIAAIGLGVAAVAVVVGTADDDGLDAFHWVATLLAAGFAFLSVTVRDGRMAVQMVNAAGLSILALAWTLSGPVPLGVSEEATPLGWQIVLLVAGLALAGFAIARREPGPGYLGGTILLLFAFGTVTADPDASLVGWPLFLIGLAVVTTAYALLRPTQVSAGPDAFEGPAD